MPNLPEIDAAVPELTEIFRDLHAHRFWLDVKSLNTRALALYASAGFVEEGVRFVGVVLVSGFQENVPGLGKVNSHRVARYDEILHITMRYCMGGNPKKTQRFPKSGELLH